MTTQNFPSEWDKKTIQENTNKQKSDSSRLSIAIFIFSSIYLHYANNWDLITKWKTFFYFVIGLFGSSILIGLPYYYFSSFLSTIVTKKIKNFSEENIKKYLKIAAIIGVPIIIIVIIAGFYATKLFFNFWY